MKSRNQVSRAAIELIKRCEGYRRKAAELPDGRWTIGYGHTLTAREGAEVSEHDAEALLMYDLIAVSHLVNEWVFTPLNQNQFDALVAFAFNIGAENFRRSSVLRRLNEGALIQAACAMELWRKAEFEGEKIVVDALVRRRSAEKALFLTPPGAWIPAPTPVVRPNIDMDNSGLVPREVPTALRASLDGERITLERDEANQERPASSERPAGPAAEAAASVSTRLAGVFREGGAPVMSEPPRLVVEDAVALAPFPHAAADAVFVLTPPEEELEPAEIFKEPRLELVAANESEPTLFEGEPEPGEVSVDTPADIFSDRLGPRPRAKRKVGLAPAVALAGAGLAVFGGSVFWAMSTPPAHMEGPLSRGAVVWLAGILGVSLIGVAVYLILDRLGRPPLEQIDGRSDPAE